MEPLFQNNDKRPAQDTEAFIVHVHTLEHYKMFNLVENFSISKTSENTLNLSMLSKVLYESRSERDWWAVPTPTLRSGHSAFLSLLYQSLLSETEKKIAKKFLKEEVEKYEDLLRRTFPGEIFPLSGFLSSGIILIDVHCLDCIFIYFRKLTQNQQ